MPDEPRQQGFVISDLHLFTSRTNAHRWQERMHAAAAEADYFVLNGDIVDFRWSELPGVEPTAAAAEDWLDELCSAHPGCDFYYVLGNHDGLEAFAARLENLAQRRENFHWHASHVRIGRSLFLHGDLPIHACGEDPLDRPLLPSRPAKGRGLRTAYRLAFAVRIQRLITLWMGPKNSARRILHALKTYHPELAGELRDVYFGHIHRVFQDFQHEGIRFHNTGCALRGLQCKPLTVCT